MGHGEGEGGRGIRAEPNISEESWENKFGENELNRCLPILFKDRILTECVKPYLHPVEHTLGT